RGRYSKLCMPVAARCPSGNPGGAWSDVMANAASAEEQSAQQAEAPEKDSPQLDLSDAAVKEVIKTATARGYVKHDELNAVLPSEEVSSEQIEATMSMAGLDALGDGDLALPREPPSR